MTVLNTLFKLFLIYYRSFTDCKKSIIYFTVSVANKILIQYHLRPKREEKRINILILFVLRPLYIHFANVSMFFFSRKCLINTRYLSLARPEFKFTFVENNEVLICNTFCKLVYTLFKVSRFFPQTIAVFSSVSKVLYC